jgi:hypothetical protein
MAAKSSAPTGNGARNVNHSPRPVIARAALLFLLFGVCGCAGKGDVNGKLTMAGKPVTTGAKIVVLTPSGDMVGWAMVDAQGNFRLENIPTGVNPVLVYKALPPGVKPGNGFIKTPPSKSSVAIPARYQNKESGLTVTVEPGENTCEIRLEP